MRILIRNPAPATAVDRPFWGDFHYGLALKQCLVDLGYEIKIQYWPNWDEAEADVLLVLRGLREISEIKGEFNQKFVWLISHPEDISDTELRLFDIVLAGSSTHTEELRQRGFTAQTFPQCTDSRVFYPGVRHRSDFRNAFVFVGNCRGNRRQLLEWAIEAQLPLRVWGRLWTMEKHLGIRVDEYYPNQKLGDLYRNSYCTLNDHWEDMIAFNYVNNRVFDALACALPLLTEPNPGMDDLNLRGYKEIHPDESFDDAVDEFIVNYHHYQEAAYDAAFLIAKQHTFQARAQQFVALLK